MVALKEFTLYGSRYAHGSPIPGPVWGRCDKRLRAVLTRNRYVTLEPTVAADSPPVSTQMPRNAGGPTSRKRKAV